MPLGFEYVALVHYSFFFKINYADHACSSLFLKSIFASVNLEDVSYLKQQVASE